MNGDITLEARWQWRSAAEVISPFIIFAVLDVSFRSYKLSINYRVQLFYIITINNTGVCGQGMSNVFAAPPIKYFKIFFRLSIPNPNPNPNLKP